VNSFAASGDIDGNMVNSLMSSFQAPWPAWAQSIRAGASSAFCAREAGGAEDRGRSGLIAGQAI
jgi:hypothetical protein